MPKMIVYLKKSNRPGKKYMVSVDGKIVHFGAAGMSDYTKHKDKDRMKRYSDRHKRGGETWTKSGIKTAGFWSKWLLWNKPTIGGSKKDIASRFNVTFKSGWPQKHKVTMRKSRRKSRKVRKSRRKARKSRRKSRKSRRKSRKSRRKSRKSRRKSGKSRRKSRKSRRKSRKSRRKSRKSRRKSLKSRRKSRKSRRKSRKRKSGMGIRRKSRNGRSGGPKYERCVLAIKAKQPKSCNRRGKWVGGKECKVNPFAVCTARVGRNN